MVSSLAFALLASVVVYPEYPAAIERDRTYDVRVIQDGAAYPLPVYNHCEKSCLSERTHGGDVNRRFCEFAFDGGPVIVEFTVHEDVKAYKVFPASKRLRHGFKDGRIRVKLEKPTLFGLQLNDSDKSILSVFADAPERAADIPAKGDPAVMYVEGWVDAPGKDGILRPPPEMKEVYLAPGSVLNARLRLPTPKMRVHGRGMVLDPMSDIFRYDQVQNPTRGLVNIGGWGTTVEDIKLIDARTFNFMAFTTGVTFRNVKVLASMMCSDGITYGVRTGGSVDGAWLYVGDNALVVSGTTNAVFRNVVMGTSCAAIFPQSNNTNVKMEDIDVFRCDDGLINNRHNGPLRRNNKWSEMTTELQKAEPGPQDSPHLVQDFAFTRLSAVDCTLYPHFFSGRNMGRKPKTFTFRDVSLPSATGASTWRAIGKTGGTQIGVENDSAKFLDTDNYTFAFTNLVLDGALVDAFPAGTLKGTPTELAVSVTKAAEAPQVPLRADRAEVNWTCPPERRLPPEKPLANLLQDRPATRSIWQRVPSWLVKLEATGRDEKGAVIYRLVQCERGAGMQAVLTERVKAAGYGVYHLAFEAKATSANPFDLEVKATSNEGQHKAKFADFDRSGAWRRYDCDIDLTFDPAVNDLVSLGLFTTATADEISFRNFKLSH